MEPTFYKFAASFPDGPTKPERQELTNEIATLDRDINPRSYNGILQEDDDTLASRGGAKGLRIYDELERDGHAYSVLQKRRMAVIARDWTVEAASDNPLDQQAAEVVRAQLAAGRFDQLTLALLDATLKGYSVAEVMWVADDTGYIFKRGIPRDQRRFVFTTEGELRMLVRENMQTGIELPPRKFIRHTFGAKDDNPYGLGMGTRLFWYCWFKRQVLGNWLIFTDKFAAPTVVGEYPPGTPKAEQDLLLRAAASLSTETAITIPQGLVLKLIEAGRTGGADAYERFLAYCDQMISEIVLGETLTTNQGSSGSRALGEVHNEVRLELVKADADLLSDTINDTLVRWIVELNVPGAKPPTVYRVFPEDLDKRADRDNKIRKLGYKPTPEYIQRVYGDGWVPDMPPVTASSTRPAPAFAAPEAPDASMGVTDQAEEAAPLAMAGLLDPVRELVTRARSLEEIRDGLLELAPKMDGSEFSKLMAQALVIAQLAGRQEVMDGF